ncbi:MAG: hypothetical protein K2X55_29795 [Burkholderiaceae bacterium]|nr:hypothetical protein [Burkholderiaceae bacterium]
MIVKRQIVYALLSLLLVLSQQLGMVHAISHWSDSRQSGQAAQQLQQPDLEKGGSAGLALDHNCSQCAAFAQLASALPTQDYAFPAVAYSALAIALATAQPQRAPFTRPYDSRAPPLA